MSKDNSIGGFGGYFISNQNGLFRFSTALNDFVSELSKSGFATPKAIEISFKDFQSLKQAYKESIDPQHTEKCFKMPCSLFITTVMGTVEIKTTQKEDS